MVLRRLPDRGDTAVHLERRLVRTALVANLVFTVPHFVFHATHLDHYPVGSAIAQTVALGLAVALPLTLLARTVRRPRPHRPDRPTPT